jgi:alkylation response protein AidB-like acyl-CoA dehydrogenase
VANGINFFKADLREIRFRLFEQFRLAELLGKPPYEDWDVDAVNMLLDEVLQYVNDKVAPTNQIGDQVGCTLQDGAVKTPPGFKEAWDALYKAGYRAVSLDPKHGGAGAPFSVGVASEELVAGANAAFAMYPGLTVGAAEVIATFGDDKMVETFCRRMYAGQWAGTMCLTEPHAGSDVGAATTKAVRQGDGTYLIEGTKIFISAGDHDLAENIIHLVLARTPGAPAGTKGLSLFAVPRNKIGPGGQVLDNNDVAVGSIEHKMGINGSSTAVLNFGENGTCVGYLIGPEEGQGMRQMFKMMNFARIGVGLQGLAVASTAYLNALEYAKERKQGPNIKNWKDPEAPKVPIIQHPDVRRMLLDMKARVEGIRALILKLCVHVDRERLARGSNDQLADYHQGQVDLLVPLVKAYGSDQAFRVCETAIQTYGGAGYLHDHPVEQYCRDSKIFSIYEGTNHIQAMDLVGRKFPQRGGANFQAFAGDVTKFVKENKDHPRLAADVAVLDAAMEALSGTAMQLFGWFQGGDLEVVPLAANAVLELMAETAVGWLLLDGAAIACARLPELADDHPDKAFYEGAVYSAQYFARNILALAPARAKVIRAGERSPLDIPEAGF